MVAFLGLVAANKEPEVQNSKTVRKFGRNTVRIHPSGPVGKLATRALLMEFRKSVILSGQRVEERRKSKVLVDSCEVDLSQCQCAEVCIVP